MSRKNENEIYLYSHIKNNKQFSKDWDTKKLEKNPNKYIQSVLDISSKKLTGNHGEPDLLYCNENEKLLILLENKYSTKEHCSETGTKEPIEYAVDGVRHYLSFFLPQNLSAQNSHLKDWRIIGIAFSGNIYDEYNRKIDTFVIKENIIENIQIKELLDEEDYIALFETIDLEKISNDIAKSSQKINNQLRNIDSQNRPVLLSALMISLLKRDTNDFRKNYQNFKSETIADSISDVVKRILKEENLGSSKIDILINQLEFLKTDIDLRNNNTSILKDILDELKNNVIPLFSRKSNYDIIGKFYEEFLKYAGIANVKKGIVLTPQHITTLFTDLLDIMDTKEEKIIKRNDIFFDPCCGTGAFLIAAMNKLHSVIDNSDVENKQELKNKVKENQLLGFEKNSTMFSLSISNMLFRGDGKSKIYNEDFFSEEAKSIMDKIKMKPTIGFINPPYGGRDNSSNPTKKEIQFLETMLDSVSRYGIIIAPLSTYFQEQDIRNSILSKHTLKYVINMPNDLFQPNAMTHTSIAVFKTHESHGSKEVVFYNLEDDGFVLSKNRGRTDRFNKWKNIKKKLLDSLKNAEIKQDKIQLLKKSIGMDEEWIIQAHSETDYSTLSNLDFEKAIKEYTIFKTKLSLDLLDKDMDDISMLEILNSGVISAKTTLEEDMTNEA